MPLGNPRIGDFQAYLTLNNIPITGVSDNNNGTDPYPQGVTINYLPAATAEQIAWAEDAREEFDWRRRRMLTRAQIAGHIAGLTANQQNTILRHMVSQFIRDNKASALAAIAELGANLPIDELDPT